MYLLNYLSLQNAQAMFLAVGRLRTQQILVGPIDGLNQTYLIPSGEKFSHQLPYLTVAVYYNGQRLILLDDFIVQESGGPGLGYDTVVFGFSPKPGDKLMVDYVVP